MPNLLRSLKVQIIFAITLLTGLFATSALYSMRVIDHQRADDALLRLAAELIYGQQHLTVQAMEYKENAPRDYPSYYRDLGLYFKDLNRTRASLDNIIEAFSTNRFEALDATIGMRMQPKLSDETLRIAKQLSTTWAAFTTALVDRLGPDPQEPRLEWAAETIIDHHKRLEASSMQLVDMLDSDVAARAAQAQQINRLLLGLAILVAIGIAAWFYWRVLRPMADAVAGFRKVANGDFSHRVSVRSDNELGWLVGAFNQLAGRLETLRRLLTRLEQGGDLSSTLRTLSETLPHLMPVDWIGVLIVGVDGRIHLEQAFSDGKPDPIGQHSFDTDRTLLEECLHTRQPLHIADVQQLSELSENYVFLKRLLELGRRDAIFLPVGGNGSGVQGVVVFASRFPNSYRSEHLELLRNLGVLVGVSLGRTLQLVTTQRLASIGQFASGIVHEVRNPLATISLALDHLEQIDTLPENSLKRISLAGNEIARLERLLADILVYAKPLVLNREPADIVEILREVIESEPHAKARIKLQTTPCPAVRVDSDRIRQVLINLIRNALQASPEGEPITITCAHQQTPWVMIGINNGGAPIPVTDQDRIFDPFFTTKTGGTGLGLPIVQRLLHAHGGQISLSSSEQDGTTFTIRIPSAISPLEGEARPA